MLRNKVPLTCIAWVLYGCATLQFIRYYVVVTTFYLDMPRYLEGRERLPFQERVLPIFLMWPINHSAFLMRHLAHPKGGFDDPSAATSETLAFYIVSLVSFSIAAFLVNRLYRLLTITGTLSVLVFPSFLVLCLWTYVVHVDANFSYPYDFPSLAFFAGGLLAIFTRRYVPLLVIMFVGTMNRETTLFLIIIYVLDAISIMPPNVELRQGYISPRERFALRQMPWLRATFLLAIWLSVRLTIYHHFAHNDNSENYVRLRENLGRIRLRLFPTLFNICGYVLPIVFILRRQLRPLRFASYLYVLPFWIGVMFYTGVVLETRVYGELCSFTAIAVVLLLENHVASHKASVNSQIAPQIVKEVLGGAQGNWEQTLEVNLTSESSDQPTPVSTQC